jgi:hypothetical protein
MRIAGLRLAGLYNETFMSFKEEIPKKKNGILKYDAPYFEK